MFSNILVNNYRLVWTRIFRVIQIKKEVVRIFRIEGTDNGLADWKNPVTIFHRGSHLSTYGGTDTVKD